MRPAPVDQERSGLAVAAVVLGVVGLAAMPLALLLLSTRAVADDPTPVAGAAAMVAALACGLLAVALGLVARHDATLPWLARTGVVLGLLALVAFAVGFAVR